MTISKSLCMSIQIVTCTNCTATYRYPAPYLYIKYTNTSPKQEYVKRFTSQTYPDLPKQTIFTHITAVACETCFSTLPTGDLIPLSDDPWVEALKPAAQRTMEAFSRSIGL